MKNVVIIGAGGFGREVYWHSQNSIGYKNQWIIKGFIDDNSKLSEILEVPLLGSTDNYQIQSEDVFVCAIADPKTKSKVVGNMISKGAEFINLVHRNAMISPSAKIGLGNIFCPFTLVSVNVNIGDFVVVNSYSSVGHDTYIGSYSSIMGHVDITGDVFVGEYAYFGSGSIVLPKSNIGAHSKIGAGSVVLKKVKEHQTVFGNPAMPI